LPLPFVQVARIKIDDIHILNPTKEAYEVKGDCCEYFKGNK